ncbi:hypothetical protein O0L34_g8887 [Tuta absoluta]|nr:hypothetical protein O0L34_g8887 [Tuta absoluta]
MGTCIVLPTFLALCMIYYTHAQQIQPPPIPANCTTAGRIANTADTTCRTYFLCVFNTGNASFVGYTYTCPNNSTFNPASGQCTTNYVCPTANAIAPANNVCTADGFVADPTVTDCSSYIQCTQINGAFVQTTLTCPANTFYNPTTTFCDPNFSCTPTVAFTCTAVGRFPNPADTTCQTYFFCVANTNINATVTPPVTPVPAFNQIQYTCPTTSVFSPLSRLCTTAYVCGS